MNEEKTIREWLNELPEPYRTQALDNAKSSKPYTINAVKPNLHNAILGAFVWRDAPQGFNYWQDVYSWSRGHVSPTSQTKAKTQMTKTLSTECVCTIRTRQDGTEVVSVESPRWAEIEKQLNHAKTIS